jgi:hypothetical protein
LSTELAGIECASMQLEAEQVARRYFEQVEQEDKDLGANGIQIQPPHSWSIRLTLHLPAIKQIIELYNRIDNALIR